MSRTTVYGAFEEGDMVSLGDCQNAFRGAMWIWSKLGDRHIPGYGYGQESAVWELASNSRLSDAEHYALVSTFDGALCPRELMLVVAEALGRFNPGTENLTRQAKLIRDAHNKGARAIGWQQTSVCCNPWEVEEEEEEDDYRPWNIDRDAALLLSDMGKPAGLMRARGA